MARKNGRGDWRNRISSSGEMPANQFLAHELNARRHPTPQREALRGSLDELGWIAPVIVSKRSGKVLDGHARVEEALSKNEAAMVPYVEVDVSKAEERLILASYDPITGLAEYDREALDALLKEVQTGDSRLQEMLAGLASDNGLYLGTEQSQDDEQAVADAIDRAAELNEKWKVKPGDLWHIGQHRLLCGDSTKREDVERLMGDRQADIFISDPPYGVGYVEKAKAMHERGYVHSRARLARHIENDETTVSDDNIAAFIQSVLTLWWSSFLKPGGAFYLFCPPGKTEGVFRQAVSEFATIRQCIVWVKNNFVIGRQDYHWRHEPILYGWLEGAAHYFADDRSQDTVWEEARDSGDRVHPTMKPVSVFERMFRNSSRQGEVGVDPFIGSGTAMLAAERCMRICYGMENEPAYCAVILERMTIAFPALRIARVGDVKKQSYSKSKSV